MEYPYDLQNFNFNQLKIELHEKIAEHQTVDQQRVKMVQKLRAVISKMLVESK